MKTEKSTPGVRTASKCTAVHALVGAPSSAPWCKLTPEEIFERDLSRTAIHETGHVLVADYFHLNPSVALFPTHTRDTLNENTVAARTWYAATTSFREACIGFAGEIAVEMLDQGEAFEEGELQELYNYLLSDGALLGTDLAAIEGHPQKYRAAKTAWRILEQRRAVLEVAARDLARVFREIFSLGAALTSSGELQSPTPSGSTISAILSTKQVVRRSPALPS